MSRKIIHIGTGPIFVLCWLLFNSKAESRWLAALVPLLITIQFALVGLGVLRDDAAVQAMSRSGDRREILKGPLYYGAVFVVTTLIFWKDSPVGIAALMILCGGDGLADILGRRFPIVPLPWNRMKSVGGSLAVFLGGYILAALVLGIYTVASALPGPFPNYLRSLLLVSLGATAIESLPLRDIDNLTVPLSAILIGIVSF